ncbi:dockerin type I repeat-containing protein [Ruminococcus flavefaciens]|uniref:dockerin type I repeat-containing protein n=1 Tax=Ruminococcus flavefaciens TaxID=1265 RepID=UPI000463E4E0|nr:dockerin type I repeat-containing protein [Ruminococcus flavefaciens]
MRKFTKEIASLLATVTVSASVNAANIQSEELVVQLAGQAVNPDSISEPLSEEIPDTAGIVAPPDIYTEPETTIPPLMGDIAPETTTTTTTVPPLMGTFVTTMPTTTTETIPSVAGGFLEPATTTTTSTSLPPFVGTMTAATTTTVVTTTTTSEEEIPPLMGEMAYVPGDVNGDYEFNVADIVALQRYILHMPESNINDWYMADLCEDGEINIFDLVVMRRELLRHMRYSDTSVFDK